VSFRTASWPQANLKEYLPFTFLANTVSIECCYQNVGLAMSFATAIFDGDELAQAIGVPVYYGFVESVIVSSYCVWAWKQDWTSKFPSANDTEMVLVSGRQ